MEPIISATPPATDAELIKAELIKDGTTASFETDVIAASRETPIIVDFWAPWCGPCKQLGPALEKVVRAANGAVRLVKINIDENQELAQQLAVQSIPAVFAFAGGQPVDGFSGALPESQIKAFVDKLLAGAKAPPSPVDAALAQAAAAFEAGEHAAAANIYGQVLAHDPAAATARAGLVRCALATGDLAGARKALEGIPEGTNADPDMTSALTALELAEQGQGSTGEVQALKDRVAGDGNDHQARYDLALALYGNNDAAGAMDELLELVRRNRAWDEEAARKQILKIFEALGPTHELTLDVRRRLSSILFS